MLISLMLAHAFIHVNKTHTSVEEIKRYLKTNAKTRAEHLFLLTELNENVKNFSTSERAVIKDAFNRFAKK